jgi:hypothetical protein
MRNHAHLKNLLLFCLLIAGLPLVVAALPALAQDATAEATAEITAEATTEVTVEATAAVMAEMTMEATTEATAEIVPTVAPTPTPETEAEAEPVTGLTALMLLAGIGAVAAVGGVVVMRERRGKNEDKV